MLLLIAGSVTATAFLIVIHFFGLRLRQKLEFSHIQFLAALNAQTRSVRKVHNLLLLLVRCIFVLSALAAFLLYFYSSQKSVPLASQNLEVVIDRTWSMQSQMGGAETKKMAQAATDASSILNQKADSRTERMPAGSAERREVETHGGAVFSSAEELLNPIQQSSARGSIFLFSDFQKADFTPAVLDDLAKLENVSLVPYPSAGPNFYIDSVWLEVPVVTPGNAVSLWARLASSLQEESKQVSVQVKEGNSLLGTTQLLLEPGQKRMVNFKLNLESADATQLVLEVEDQVNPFDNQFFLVVPKPSVVPIKVSPSLANNHPVIQAYKEEPAFKFSGNNEQNALWILENNGLGISSTVVQQAKQWLEQGNSILVLPGEKNQQALISFFSSIGLNGIKEAAQGGGEKVLKQPDMSDTFFKSIFEKEVRNLKMPAATPSLTWQSAYHTILRFTDNSPFLSTFKVGNGEVHLFSAPVQRGSSFASHPLFVPVLYQLALNSVGTQQLAHQPLNGQVNVSLPQVEPGQEPYKLRSNGVAYIPQQKIAQRELQMVLPEEVGQPGFYEVMKGETVVGHIALNIPRSQSKLDFYSAEELKKQMAERESQVKVIEPDARISLQKQLQKTDSVHSLWKYCLILCLLCLIIEAVVLSARKRGSLI